MKKYNENEIVVMKICHKVKNLYGMAYFDFYDPTQQKLIEKTLKDYNNIYYSFFGGHKYCERKMLYVYTDLFLDADNWPIKVVNFSMKNNINHRDVLGSLMGLGIVRDVLGDINIFEDTVQIFVKENIADYIKNNLCSIGKYKIVPKILNVADGISIKPVYRDKSIIIPSVRLDAIISSAYSISRSKATEMINKGYVKVNHEVVYKSSFLLKESDLVSVRGKGRIIFEEICGKTRKENIKIHIKEFI